MALSDSESNGWQVAKGLLLSVLVPLSLQALLVAMLGRRAGPLIGVTCLILFMGLGFSFIVRPKGWSPLLIALVYFPVILLLLLTVTLGLAGALYHEYL